MHLTRVTSAALSWLFASCTNRAGRQNVSHDLARLILARRRSAFEWFETFALFAQSSSSRNALYAFGEIQNRRTCFSLRDRPQPSPAVGRLRLAVELERVARVAPVRARSRRPQPADRRLGAPASRSAAEQCPQRVLARCLPFLRNPLGRRRRVGVGLRAAPPQASCAACRGLHFLLGGRQGRAFGLSGSVFGGR